MDELPHGDAFLRRDHRRPSRELLAKCRIGDDLEGYQVLLDLLADHGDSAEMPIPVAIETSRGLLVATLRTGARQIFAFNPMAASRYRDRHGVSRKKSDPGDALMLANIIRTDMPMHRPLTADTDLAQAAAVLARAQQDAVWNRQQVCNQLRSLLRSTSRRSWSAFKDKPGGLDLERLGDVDDDLHAVPADPSGIGGATRRAGWDCCPSRSPRRSRHGCPGSAGWGPARTCACW
ncbi:hypothetical protein J2Z77_000762 [Streptomyces avidinii]|uniref:Transposase IS110-like N-terminal domain-containing protein n=1 Tax=Streptomyces avidinii TaxID=1895 RepID=A0ABS4KY76_STRAV|nr:hypothetical protein [Streptomyces avidinii]